MDRDKAEARVRELTDFARGWLAERNADATEIALYDQASAGIRDYVATVGADVTDPMFCLGWYLALDALRFIASDRKEICDDDLVMVLVAGLSGRINDGDGSGGS